MVSKVSVGIFLVQYSICQGIRPTCLLGGRTPSTSALLRVPTLLLGPTVTCLTDLRSGAIQRLGPAVPRGGNVNGVS